MRFSIVVDNCNYERYLERALASALGQDYARNDYEVIAVDDGSTDGSREILRRFAGAPGLSIVEQQNAGQAAAFAAGVARARGELVCLLDSDDEFRPGKLAALERHVGALGGAHQDLFLCHDLALCDEDGRDLERSWFEHANLASLERTTVKQGGTYPFAVPSGQVYSRALLADVVEAVPAADWRTGADNPIAHAALLRTGVVHYLHEKLARYRIHAASRLLGVEDGKLAARPHAHALHRARRPKLLWFLERYLDTLPLSRNERHQRIGHLKRLEATLPVSAAQARVPQPLVSFVVGGAQGAALDATLEALERQTHAPCEVLVAEAPGTDREVLAALARARGHYLAIIEAGDRPDRIFAERQVHAHRYLWASMVSACDYRLEVNGQLLLEHAYARLGLWPKRRRIAPLARPQGSSRWWAFTPRSGNVLRRTAMLELFLSHAARHGWPQPAPLQWLLLHYAAALGGCTQLPECLTTLRAESADPLGMHLRHPQDQRFVPRLPQPQSGRFFLELAAAHPGAFREHFGPHLKRFERWALRLDAPAQPA